MDAKTLANKHMIFKGISGSHAYGLATPTSDIDYRGVFLPPLDTLLNPLNAPQQVNDDTNDEQIYSFPKYFKLLVEQNPNIIELLWLPEEMILQQSQEWFTLRTYRDELLSKKAYWKFSKYAFDQMNRIKGHNKWISKEGLYSQDNPPRHYQYCRFLDLKTGEDITPTRGINLQTWNKFGAKRLSETIFMLFENGIGVFDKKGNFKANEPTEFDKSKPAGLLNFQKEEYKKAETDFKGFFEWKKNRNPDRAKLEHEFGYDTKHASHLIRLQMMGCLILERKEVWVRLPDDMLSTVQDIKFGKKTYEQVIKISDELKSLSDGLFESSTLRDTIDTNLALDLYTKIVTGAKG